MTDESELERKRMKWVWESMKQRCLNPNNRSFSQYGGRGIKVSDEWLSFANFLADVSPRPKGMSLDRIDNNGGYSKENFRWASRKTQNLNKRPYKSNEFGLRGIETRPYAKGESGYRVRIRRDGKLVCNRSFTDFFEACCCAKKFELFERE